jgi:hypothetical protein
MLLLLCWVSHHAFGIVKVLDHPSLARNSDLNGVVSSMKQMEDRFNKKFQYPYVFLNEKPFEDTFKAYVSQC